MAVTIILSLECAALVHDTDVSFTVAFSFECIHYVFKMIAIYNYQ